MTPGPAARRRLAPRFSSLVLSEVLLCLLLVPAEPGAKRGALLLPLPPAGVETRAAPGDVKGGEGIPSGADPGAILKLSFLMADSGVLYLLLLSEVLRDLRLLPSSPER